MSMVYLNLWQKLNSFIELCWYGFQIWRVPALCCLVLAGSVFDGCLRYVVLCWLALYLTSSCVMLSWIGWLCIWRVPALCCLVLAGSVFDGFLRYVVLYWLALYLNTNRFSHDIYCLFTYIYIIHIYSYINKVVSSVCVSVCVYVW